MKNYGVAFCRDCGNEFKIIWNGQTRCRGCGWKHRHNIIDPKSPSKNGQSPEVKKKIENRKTLEDRNKMRERVCGEILGRISKSFVVENKAVKKEDRGRKQCVKESKKSGKEKKQCNKNSRIQAAYACKQEIIEHQKKYVFRNNPNCENLEDKPKDVCVDPYKLQLALSKAFAVPRKVSHEKVVTKCVNTWSRGIGFCKECGKEFKKKSNAQKLCEICAEEIRQTPEYKEKIKAYQKAYRNTPEIKAKVRAYYETPEYKEKIRAYQKKYCQSPEFKERMREYRQRPEVKKMKNKREREERQAINFLSLLVASGEISKVVTKKGKVG
jgi:tetratricopeptide (TPR) repeat protein